MNDPWDVKSVRQSGQYVSCMKINGVPLLPPVLSKECRNEMQYYKLLAKEVEKRINFLQSYIKDQSEENTSENEENHTKDPPNDSTDTLTKEIEECTDKAQVDTDKLTLDLTFNYNEDIYNVYNTKKDKEHNSSNELPERDCNTSYREINQKEIELESETGSKNNEIFEKILSFNLNINRDPAAIASYNQDGPSSLSSKSFTGSLIDIHTETLKESQKQPKLIRHGSYTVLKPSPQLLAHLEIQSQSTGMDMMSISMSESLSNLSQSPKKRRSWDLESAKVKWSSMALELNQKNMKNTTPRTSRQTKKSSPPVSNPRAKSQANDKGRRGSLNSIKNNIKSEPIQKATPKKSVSPVRQTQTSSGPNRTTERSPANQVTISPKTVQGSPKVQTPNSVPTNQKSPTVDSNTLALSPTKILISNSEDPASKVRELYEKIQKQQLMQMTSLVEKQKREQLLLQQLFEEQNNLLFKQLKTICPKSPIEVRQAWTEKDPELVEDRGPVSLSQLNNVTSPRSLNDTTISCTLSDTSNYINQCDNVLKKGRNIINSLKKPQNGSSANSKVNSSTMNGTSTGGHTPSQSIKTSTPRRQIRYDSSSSDREYEPMLTDRTNDTMADLNVTFPTDDSGNCDPFVSNDNTVLNQACEDLKAIQSCNIPVTGMQSVMKCIKDVSVNSDLCRLQAKQGKGLCNRQPTNQECEAASRIVAYAKGYLVRRLMRSDRVQATVQTIRDALLCALQLHQDRNGIRGADVDLHRRLIQQITAACYSLHDTFIASSPAERCALIKADRARKKTIANRTTPPPFVRNSRHSDIMSKSHSGAFPARPSRASLPADMTSSHYETFSLSSRARRRPWR